MKRLWAIILAVVMGAAWGVGACDGIAFCAFTRGAPETPQPGAGRVWDQIDHSHIYYLTAYQASALKLLEMFLFPGVLVFFAAFLLLPRRQGIRRILQPDGWWPDDAGLVIAMEAVGVAASLALCLLAGPRLVEWLMATGRLAPGYQ